ncbi:hypothetical protein HEAR1390 [Herminiimonas arsenicoxydans]|uniref:Uncharacterized protein n=1 Tax=Herminiimonas arsenicoxydans TaxID=204773 RepID=A4G4X5_HERAR|nr:hypothetical protein HEAR1390 [Herminiimonas arsenicoxydans]
MPSSCKKGIWGEAALAAGLWDEFVIGTFQLQNGVILEPSVSRTKLKQKFCACAPYSNAAMAGLQHAKAVFQVICICKRYVSLMQVSRKVLVAHSTRLPNTRNVHTHSINNY